MIEHLDKPYQSIKALPANSMVNPPEFMAREGLSEDEVKVIILQALIDEVVEPMIRPMADDTAEWLTFDKLMTLGHLKPDEIRVNFRRK